MDLIPSNIENLHVIESPFQLLCSMSAYDYFKSRSVLIIKYNAERENDEQIVRLKSYIKHDKIIEVKPFFSNFDANIKLFFLLKNIINSKKKFEKIFIGEFLSFHMRKFFDCLPVRECYSLDDGSSAYEVGRLIENEEDNFNFIGKKGKIKKTIYFMQLCFFDFKKYQTRRNINMFTFFDVNLKKNGYVVNHDLLPLSKEDSKKKYSTIYFYGSPVDSLGVSDGKYIEFLNKIFSFYQKKGLNVIYFPHRKEREKKIKKIAKTFTNIEIRRSDYPAEMQLYIDGVIPMHIASFFSTVLLSLPKIYNIKNVDFFSFDLSLLLKKHRVNVKSLENRIRSIANEIKI